jgi:ribonuclease HI
MKRSPLIQDTDHLIAFFDGASILRGQNCGAGGVFKFSAQKVCRWHLNGGSVTNSKAQLLGAPRTLTMEKMWNITKLKVFGDSKDIIDWINNICILKANHLEGWKYRTKELSSQFQEINYNHIFRDFNKEADLLSKQAFLGPSCRLTYFLLINGKAKPPNHLNLF